MKNVPALPAVLVVDDEVRSQEALRRTLEEDFTVFTASGADEAMAIMEREQGASGGKGVQVVLCDQRMPGTSGVAFLTEVRQRWPDVVRIVLSGYTEAGDIIAGINEAGIYQYLLKPWQPEQLLLTLKSAANVWRLQQDNQRLSLELRAAEPVLASKVEMKYERVKRELGLDGLTRSAGSPMNPVCDMVQRIAPYDLSVLLMGESGTGKEMLARAIHYQSRRDRQAFVVENCGALPDQLLEAELFGYKRGAFTGAYEDRIGLFQQADGGTIFLDEIGETSPAFQVKLLRVLQEGEFRPLGSPRPVSVNVRVIAATNRDLEAEVREGRFREDLYYRIHVIPISLPPLRQRQEDIPILVYHFLNHFNREMRRSISGFSPDAMQCLLEHRWPGNVRELRNVVERAVALSTDDTITPALLVLGREGVTEFKSGLLPLDEAREEFDRAYLAQLLNMTRGNVSRAAALAGRYRAELYKLLRKYGMDPSAFREESS